MDSLQPEVLVDSQEPELPVDFHEPEVPVDSQDLEVVDSPDMEVPVEVEVPVDSYCQQEEV